MSTPREAEHDRAQCSPCRGTGRVISARGGERHEVTCPWCGGSGLFRRGRDAQSGAQVEPREEPPVEP